MKVFDVQRTEIFKIVISLKYVTKHLLFCSSTSLLEVIN